MGANGSPNKHLKMRLSEVNWLRLLAITSILIWHCFICPSSHWDLLDDPVYSYKIGKIGSFLMPEANMPLFTFLSGYLFSFLYNSKKKGYETLRAIFKNKVDRLLIPFLVLGSLATLCVPSRPFLKGMFFGDGSSLWFCAMLFWCTIIRSLVLFSGSKWLKYIILILSVFSIVNYGSNYRLPYFVYHIPVGFWCVNKAIYFYLFFVLGDYVYKNRDRIITVKLGGGTFSAFFLYNRLVCRKL